MREAAACVRLLVMRWYVSRQGETVGPVDEQTLVGWIRGGMRDASIRDETGGEWMALEMSPFAKLLAGSPAGPKAALVVGLACGLAGLLIFGVSAGVIGLIGGGVFGLVFGNVKLN